jgi:predicted heme/steroid binding protein
LENNNVQNDIVKFYQNGQVYIMVNGVVYNVMGQMVK